MPVNNYYPFDTTYKFDMYGSDDGSDPEKSNSSNTPSLVDSEENNRSRASSEEAFYTPPVLLDNLYVVLTKLEGKTKEEINAYFNNKQAEINNRADIQHAQITDPNPSAHRKIDKIKDDISRDLSLLKGAYEDCKVLMMLITKRLIVPIRLIVTRRLKKIVPRLRSLRSVSMLVRMMKKIVPTLISLRSVSTIVRLMKKVLQHINVKLMILNKLLQNTLLS
jgi:hypothetical protein